MAAATRTGAAEAGSWSIAGPEAPREAAMAALAEGSRPDAMLRGAMPDCATGPV